MRSRAATRAIIEKETIYLVTIIAQKVTVPIAGGKNVKSAFEFAKLVGRISEPNRSYKSVIRELKKNLLCKVWDKAKHGETCPDSDYVDIRPIKLI